MSAREYKKFIGLYFFLYYALGALIPLLSQYLKSIGFSGTQVGIIASVGPVVAIISQPMWGILADKSQKIKLILFITGIIPAVLAIFVPALQSFLTILICFAIIQFFQQATTPMADSIVLHSRISFGKVRQWGAIGFAMAVFITAQLAEMLSLSWIFYFYSIAMVMFVLCIKSLTIEKVKMSVSIWSGLKQLLRLPRYSLFLICGLLMNGPVNGNNIFFGLLYEEIGGTIAGIGIAFLLFAGSEAPFMKVCSYMIHKFGIESVLILSLILSAARWFWYSLAPEPMWVIIMFFLQGISVGFFIVGAGEYVRMNTIKELKVTGMSLYASLTMGVGAVICQIIGGAILDQQSIFAVYRFFGVLTLIGLIPMAIIKLFYPHTRSV